MSNRREELEERVQNAILRESFFRWESAVLLGLTAVSTVIPLALSSVPNGYSLAALAVGLLAEAGIVYSSVKDPEFGRKVAAKLLRADFKPGRLRNPKLRKQVEQAFDYRSRIEEAIRRRDGNMITDELRSTASQFDDWIEHIYSLAERIDRYLRDRTSLERDRVRVESRLKQLRQQLNQTRDPALRKQIESTVSSMERQVTTLRDVNSTIQRAELQLENSLTHLGTIYSQTMLVDVKDIDSSRARRLRHEISEEVDELNDVLVAMDEVYSSGS